MIRHPLALLLLSLSAIVLSGPRQATAQTLPQEQAEAWQTLQRVISLACSYEYSVAARADTFPPRIKQSSEGLSEILDNIDRGNLTARLIGNIGAGEVRLALSSDALNQVLSFVDVWRDGSITVTSVFPKFVPESWKPTLVTRSLVAVHSRHVVVGSRFAVSQYYGSCEVLQ